MNIGEVKYKIIFTLLLVFVFSMLSFPTHAGGTKIIIDGLDHHRDHRFSRHDYPHRFYDNFYYDYREGFRDRYGNKFKNRYYGNESYGYGDNSGYSDQYRNRRSYCPY